MGDRPAERSGGRALDVDVDPLAILGGLGERVDTGLVDLEPVAGAERRARGIQQGVGGGESRAHALGPPAT
ncbi:hypothetical protein GCM10009761_22720 [Agromyces terreus]